MRQVVDERDRELGEILWRGERENRKLNDEVQEEKGENVLTCHKSKEEKINVTRSEAENNMHAGMGNFWGVVYGRRKRI